MFDRYIAFAARQTPYLIAISNGSEHVSYRTLDQAVDGVASLLSSHIDDDRQVVIGLSIQDGYRHSLLALACARLGMASASLFPHMAAPLAKLVGASLIVTDGHGIDGWGSKLVVAGPAWFAQAMTHEAVFPARAAVDPAGLARVQLSSGSTGLQGGGGELGDARRAGCQRSVRRWRRYAPGPDADRAGKRQLPVNADDVEASWRYCQSYGAATFLSG